MAPDGGLRETYTLLFCNEQLEKTFSKEQDWNVFLRLFVKIVEENTMGGFKARDECFLKECMEVIVIMLQDELKKKLSSCIFGFQISWKDLFRLIQFLWKM